MKISASLAVAIIAVVLLGIAGIGYYQYRQLVDPTEDGDSRAFYTEEEWTAREITQFLADMGAFSKTRKGPLKPVKIRKKPAATEGPSSLEVSCGGKKIEFSVAEGIWNPATYAGWAKEVFAKADPATPETSSQECAKTLLDPSLKTFFAENRRISDFLNEHPASAMGQLQAAILVGTIALNDFSGAFSDVRVPLNRMTAHLAVADALGMPANDPMRQLAEGIRLTLCGQQADALKEIASWPEGAVPADWSAILRLRNTLDWREGRAAALTGSTALRNEYFRALVLAIDASAGVDFLKESGAKPSAALWRIANEESLSVSNGHAFTKPILGIEIEEASTGAKEFGVAVSKENLDWMKEYLDTPEGSPVVVDGEKRQIEVAGRNLFAGSQQRQFMQGGQKLFTFLNDNWGVPDAARELESFLNGKLPALRYKPFLTRMNARTNQGRVAANAPLEVIIREHPEMVTPCLWSSLRRDEDGEKILSGPDFHAWFHPEVPVGTAFESGARLTQIGVGDENNEPWMRTLWECAPYSFPLAMHNAYLENGRTYDNLNGDILGKWLAPQVDFNLRAMRRLARSYKEQPELYEPAMKKVAALDPDYYLEMGEYFKERKLDEKAVTYYLEGFEKANDRVWMANDARWLVEYLFLKNDREMAAKVANEAAEVYSYDGLAAYMWLMEAEGQWDKALETAKKIDERYGKSGPAEELASLLRLQQQAPEKAAAAGLEEMSTRMFPSGMIRASLADFAGPPEKGVIFRGSTPQMVPFGLGKGMVVVALNGYRTDNFAQYQIIRALSSDPEMSLIVWDGKAYRVCEGNLPGRRFGVDMVDYSIK